MNTDQRLRDTRVSFVSAGALDSTRPKDAEDALAEMSLDSPTDADRIEVFEEDDEEQVEAMNPNRQSTQYAPNSSPDDQALGYVVDIHGSEPIQTGIPPHNYGLHLPRRLILAKRLFYLVVEIERVEDFQGPGTHPRRLQIPSIRKFGRSKTKSTRGRSY